MPLINVSQLSLVEFGRGSSCGDNIGGSLSCILDFAASHLFELPFVRCYQKVAIVMTCDLDLSMRSL